MLGLPTPLRAAPLLLLRPVRRQHVVAGMTVNVRDVAEPIQALIRSGRDVDPARLVDPDIPIKELADRRW
jgi:hypothetical protein